MTGGLKHAGSSRSLMHHRTMKYKYYISLIIMFLLITSLLVIFTSVSLIKWYRLPMLKTWDIFFEIAPYLMLAVGSFTFLVAFYGFFVTPLGSRCCLISFAILLSMACIAQIGSVFVTWQLSNTSKDEIKGSNKFLDELEKYANNDDIKAAWDDIQTTFHCCGIESYTDWFAYFNNRDVPKSCCRTENPTPRCGEDARTTDTPWKKYYVTGCIDLMVGWLDNDVAPLIKIYVSVGVAIAVLEIIGISLASAYAAQINRKHLKEKKTFMKNMYKEPTPGFHRISTSQIDRITEVVQDQDSEVEV